MTEWQRRLCVLYDIPPWFLRDCTPRDRVWWMMRGPKQYFLRKASLHTKPHRVHQPKQNSFKRMFWG